MIFSIQSCYTCLFLVKFGLENSKRWFAGSREGHISFLPSSCDSSYTSSQRSRSMTPASLVIPSSIAGRLTQRPSKLAGFRHSFKFNGTLAMFLMIPPLGIRTSPSIDPGISGMGRTDFPSRSVEIMISKIMPISNSWYLDFLFCLSGLEHHV